MLHSSTSSGGVTEFSVYGEWEEEWEGQPVLWGLLIAPRRKLGQVINPILWMEKLRSREKWERAGTPAPCLQATQSLDRALGTRVCLLTTTCVNLDKLLYLSASFFLNCKMG